MNIQYIERTGITNMKKKAYGFVIRSEEISADIYSMWIETDLAKDANPGHSHFTIPHKMHKCH